MKKAFVIAWIIVELSLAVMIVSPWLNPHFWLSTKISLTASFTMMGTMLSFLCYMIYKKMLKDEQ